jgi:hypothetical protein
MRFGRCLLISFLRGLLINHGTPPAPTVTQSNPIAPLFQSLHKRLQNYGRLTQFLSYRPLRDGQPMFCGEIDVSRLTPRLPQSTTS